MSDAPLEKYRPLVSDAIAAFRTDPTYAEDMARQANILRARQSPKREKELETVDR